MKEFTIAKNDAGQRLDRWLAKTLPLLPAPLAQKYIRLKRVKVNGKGSQRDVRLQEGDRLQLYINDEFFDALREDNAFLSVFQPRLDIVYEDENLLLLNKRPGLLCHADEQEKVNTLITHIQAYLYQKKEWNPRDEHSFAPALCNRIDRNTARVTVSRKPVPGGKSAATLYKTLKTADGLSLVECELLTGRTHQIRAQFAAAGHPLLGDGKYGRERDNKRYGRAFQALYSYKLVFSFSTDAGMLEYLKGRAFTVEHVDFVEAYFPGE